MVTGNKESREESKEIVLTYVDSRGKQLEIKIDKRARGYKLPLLVNYRNGRQKTQAKNSRSVLRPESV